MEGTYRSLTNYSAKKLVNTCGNMCKCVFILLQWPGHKTCLSSESGPRWHPGSHEQSLGPSITHRRQCSFCHSPQNHHSVGVFFFINKGILVFFYVLVCKSTQNFPESFGTGFLLGACFIWGYYFSRVVSLQVVDDILKYIMIEFLRISSNLWCESIINVPMNWIVV